MLEGALIALLLAQAAPAAADEATASPLALIAGDWQIVRADGEVAQSCANAQRFTVTPDRRNVILTELGVAEWSANYLVLRDDPARLLLYIEGEERLTEAGDPVLWWAYFNGPDEFRWRRYDWAPDQGTAAWRRCPAESDK